MQDSPPSAPLRSVLVTGSAGKGSIGRMLAAIFAAAGDHVLHYSDQYLHSPSERLTLDGSPIDRSLSAAFVAELTKSPAPSRAELEPLVAAASGDTASGWLVMSTVSPLARGVDAAVLAPFLAESGRSAAEVARERVRDLGTAGLAVSSLQRESVLDVLRPAFPGLIEVATHCRLARGRADLDGQEFRLKTDQAEYRLRLPILGPFQLENAATAILTAEPLASLGLEVNPAIVRAALESIKLPGRLEVIKRRPLVIVDAGALSAALPRVVEGLRALASGRHLHVILDCSAGLAPVAAIQALLGLASELTVVSEHGDSAALTDAAYEAAIPLQRAPNLTAAVDTALALEEDGGAVAVLGSRAAAAAAREQILGLMPENLRLN